MVESEDRGSGRENGMGVEGWAVGMPKRRGGNGENGRGQGGQERGGGNRKMSEVV